MARSIPIPVTGRSEAPSVLFVCAAGCDHPSLETIGRQAGWNFCHATDSAHVLRTWNRMRPAVVVCSSDQPGLDWRGLWRELREQPNPPAFILCSRLADERLWMEALNLGVCDVVRLPFDPAELLRSLSLARLASTIGAPDAQRQAHARA